MGREQGLRKRLSDGETLLGTWNMLCSQAAVEATGSSGLDFVVIDMEHGPASIETAEGLVRAAESSGMAPVVRVPCNDSQMILRSLDIGAHGVQVPHVENAGSARAAVRHARYYPEGARGLSPFTRAGRYGEGAAGHTERSNERTLVVVNVEGSHGVENLDEIAAVPGVDVVFIGPYDLSQSLGYPGDVCHKEVVRMLSDSAEKVRKRGLACGSFAKDTEYMKILIDCGVQYITYAVDSAMLVRGYKEAVMRFRKTLGEG